jgi:squalene-associated FAD-dependent desaturase
MTAAGPSTVDAVVVGGGLAGIAAAVRLADAGASVVLLESRPRLGGATYSFRRGGLAVDTGQHVFLRCYTEYRELLARLGTARLAEIQDRFEVPVLVPGAEPHWLRRSRRLPAPLHLLPAIASYRPVSRGHRVAAMRAARAMGRLDPDAAGLDDRSLGDFFTATRQPPEVVRRLWELVTVAALNVDPDHASLALAARVFRTGLLSDARAGDIGRPRTTLDHLHGTPAARLLRTLGVTVHTGERVAAIEPRGSGAGFVVRHPGGPTRAGAVVLAVPHQAAAGLVPGGAVDDPGRWARLGESAIVNVHVVYDRKVTDLEFAAAVDSPVQWVFDRTRESGLNATAGGAHAAERAPGQYLAVSLSAADALVKVPAAELVSDQLAGLAALFPAARGARVREAFVTREPRATFRQAPGSRAHRPPARTALDGLVLAGAWTDTGWPDTMEGAVHSGNVAADLLLRRRSAAPPNDPPVAVAAADPRSVVPEGAP